MKQIIAAVLFAGIISAGSVWADETAEGTAVESSKWSKAGSEISEAAGAVGEATADTSQKAWEATKEESVEIWDKTKNKSKALWEKGKAKVHDATAPDAGKTATE